MHAFHRSTLSHPTRYARPLGESPGTIPSGFPKETIVANFMAPFTSQTYALLRIVTGFLFLWHGSQKLFGFPGGFSERPFHVAYIAGSIEFFGGLLVMLGLFTRGTAFLCSGLMASAYWMSHGTRALLPIENRGELAALYCFLFLFISAQGAGICSLDALRKRSK
jgi:putative oxidoreductase